MKRRNLIGSLAAGVGVLFTRSPLATASDAPSGGIPGRDISSPRATVRVIFADTSQSSWQAVTDGGIYVAGASAITPGNALISNTQIIHDAATAIAAAGGPVLTRQQIALFGGQS